MSIRSIRVSRSGAAALAAVATSATLLFAGCAPEVGSERWCNEMKEKPKADWSPNEAVDFAKHCLLK